MGSDIRVRNDDIGLAHVAVGVETAGWTSPHAFPLMIMQTMLGTWQRTSGSGVNMASKLIQNVAERNLAHSLMTFNTSYKDTGLFGVYGVCDQYETQEFLWYALNSMTRLCHKTTDDEVAIAKSQLKASMLGQLDGTSAICEDIGRQLLTYGRRMTPAEIFARIDAVDAAAVKHTATTFINDQEVVAAGLGAIHGMPDYNWLRRRTFWLRY